MTNQYAVFWRENFCVFMRATEVNFFRQKEKDWVGGSDEGEFCAEKTCAYFQVQSKP